MGSHDLMNWYIVAPLYAAGICWTLVYDTIYAHQDKKDDAMVGVKSTALRFGDATKTWLSVFAIGFAIFLFIAGKYGAEFDIQLQWPYYASVVASFAHLLQQIHLVDYNSPQQCMAKFVSNKWIGVLLLVGILWSNSLLPHKKAPIAKEKKSIYQKIKQLAQ